DFQAGSGASHTVPAQCSTLRKNGFVMIKGRPCKIIDMSTSKTGKHGHAKVHLIGTDIFTSKKLEDISPSTHNMDVPIVTRTEYQLVRPSARCLSYSIPEIVIQVNIDDGFMNLMIQDGTPKDDVRLPEGDLGKEIEVNFEDGKDLLVTCVSACGEEQAVSFKEAPKGT
ncbi:Eukaryotic translation initiation factor 5A-2, partial [Leucoagaricus sp. SymC.cos]